MTYDWMAALVFAGTLVLIVGIGANLVFRVPALRRMRELNRVADKIKLSRGRYREAVEVNNRTALITNVVFLVAVLPLCVSLEARPLWRHAVEIVAVLMVYDLFYYLTHRFIFHGRILRKVHALHHQARTPTGVDALYVHPLETFIGLVLFLGTIPLIGALAGAPLHAVSMAIASVVFSQWNVLNHAYVNLPHFPYRTLDKITSLHAAHHVDMNQGNYATLTMLYDWLFGTLETPVSRDTP